MHEHNDEHTHHKIAEYNAKGQQGTGFIAIGDAGIDQRKKRRAKRECKEENDNNR